jgi:hypothetical protein
MTIQYGIVLRNAQLDQIETSMGTAAVLLIYTGAAPATAGAASTGTVLGTIALPADSFANAATAQKAKTGTWSGTASATGTAGYFRILNSGTCVVQGTVGTSGADLIVDNASFTTGQTFSITTFTINNNQG